MPFYSNDEKVYRECAYRIWYEFLLLAHESSDPEIKAALRKTKKYYTPWHPEKKIPVDRWWKSHNQLFAEQQVARELKRGERAKYTNSIVVEIPLVKSPTQLTKDVSEIISAAYAKKKPSFWKNNYKSTAKYKLTEGKDFRLQAMQYNVSAYAAFIKHPNFTVDELVFEFFMEHECRYVTERNDPPISPAIDPGTKLIGGKASPDRQSHIRRNMRRLIQKGRKITLNVANGEFPGTYY